LLYRYHLLNKGGVLATVALPILVVAVFWSKVNHTYLLIWALSEIMVSAVAKYWLAVRYLESRPPDSQTPRWVKLNFLAISATGVVWGAASWLMFVGNSLPHQVFLLITLLAIVGGPVTLHMGSHIPFRHGCVFIVLMLGMTAARLGMEGTLPYLALSGFFVLYMVFMIQMLFNARHITVEAARLRFENQDLVEQLKQQKEIAEAANVAKSKFLAAASHDLRQPLHALGLFASALDERIKFPEVRRLVENINQCVAALEELFNALLDISRLDAGIIQPRLQHFRLAEIASRLHGELAAQARQKGLLLNFDGPDVTVHSDPALLENMLRNLIGNAIRFTHKGEVNVVWQTAGQEVQIEVRDTGIGIPAEEQEQIFQEFRQLNNPERDRTKGLGLGLAIVRRLSTLLGCKVSVRSAVGAGSVFSLSIPLGNAALITGDSRMQDQRLENERALRVLVIDDESAVREAMKTLLGNWGHEVAAASSLEEALQSVTRAPQAIIADYRLRENQTGIEALRKLREIWGSAIPSLIITGDTAPERLREAQESGFAFMHKPVNAAKLRAFLRSASRQNLMG
jgi:signal transduction histidine kinase/CheY-like chemotaxis protein